jgi:hypothetical protein
MTPVVHFSQKLEPGLENRTSKENQLKLYRLCMPQLVDPTLFAIMQLMAVEIVFMQLRHA